MKTLFSILLGLLLVSCSEPEIPSPVSRSRQVTVRLTVYASSAQAVIRQTDEQRIADVNLFLVSDRTHEVQQYYTRSTAAQFTCMPGHYTLYVVANIHADTGYLTFDELQGYAVAQPEVWDDLVMTVERPITVLPADAPVELEPLALQRFAARIAYTVEVAPAAGGIEFRSVQAINVPARASLFSGAMPTVLTNGPILEERTGTFYMLPNCRGVVAAITDPRQKSPDVAPVGATCLRIRALRGGRVLDYFVFPGDNDTSDFNIRPNTQHTLHITIQGDNLVDVRMRYYDIDVSCSILSDQHDGICLQTAPLRLNAFFEGDFRTMGLRATLEVEQGDIKFFRYNGQSGLRTYDLQPTQEVSTHYILDYEPPVFTRSNARLIFVVRFYDRYGPAASFRFTYRYGYLLTVYTSWYYDSARVGCPHCGIVSDDADVIRGGTLSSSLYKVYYLAEGCTLRAEPEAGHRFEGWFGQFNLLGLISRDPLWHFVPDTPMMERTAYAYFH